MIIGQRMHHLRGGLSRLQEGLLADLALDAHGLLILYNL